MAAILELTRKQRSGSPSQLLSWKAFCYRKKMVQGSPEY